MQSPCPLGKRRVMLSGPILTGGAGVNSRAPPCETRDERCSPGAGGDQGKNRDMSPRGCQESETWCQALDVWGEGRLPVRGQGPERCGQVRKWGAWGMEAAFLQELEGVCVM